MHASDIVNNPDVYLGQNVFIENTLGIIAGIYAQQWVLIRLAKEPSLFREGCLILPLNRAEKIHHDCRYTIKWYPPCQKDNNHYYWVWISSREDINIIIGKPELINIVSLITKELI